MAIEGWTVSSAASKIQNDAVDGVEPFSTMETKAETAISEAAEAAEHFEIGAALDSLLTKFLSSSISGATNSGNYMVEALGDAIEAYEAGDQTMAAEAEKAMYKSPDFAGEQK
ncbi:DUF6507 family protein [Zhihengliuella flava]|uniref:Uncharacterized protein n=1 Tax=Zhihengliuella flava TaxID=1285193 RepID=A0A931D9Q6_9MICC|nr:DUF6507 family protein [Zhihengliuella flava]MBG6084939.1 hypothetical protein [Zhihengliuella flava]